MTGPAGAQFGTRAGPDTPWKGPWWDIEAEAGNYDNTFTDHGADIDSCQGPFAINNHTYGEAVRLLEGFAAKVNTLEIDYDVLGPNSNSYAHAAAEALGVDLPPPPEEGRPAPGWDHPIRLE